MSVARRLVVRARLAARIVHAFVVVRRSMKRHAIPELIPELRRSARHRADRHNPIRLGRAVARVLRVGPLRARCLVTSLVLFRLLYEEGYEPVLVIGMPDEATSPAAHAWIELAGRDVGPPPGKGVHREMLRLN